MIIEDTECKIRSLDKRIENNFIGINLVEESKELIRLVIHTFPKIKVIEQPNFILQKYNTPKYDFIPLDHRINIDMKSYAFSTSNWKFSDIDILMETFKQFDIIYLYKIEFVEFRNLIFGVPHNINPSYIIVSMVVLGWTDILLKGLTGYKF